MKYLILLIVTIGANGLLAQVPALKINDSEPANVTLQSLKIEVEVVGNIATTTYDMLFSNPANRVLEGELSMPMHGDQEVCRYALDINGKLREGVVVEKIKARQAYEAVVRGNIDPGIISKTKGNFYKTTIYPIPAKGTKRVVIGFVETLSHSKKGLQYILPIDEPVSLSTFEFTAEVYQGDEQTTPQSEIDAVSFDQVNDVKKLTFKRTDFQLSKSLKFYIPQPDNSPYQVFTEEHSGDQYFYLYGLPGLPKSTQKKSSVEKLAIFWDHSHSADQRDKETELDFLKEYLHTLKDLKEIHFYGFDYDLDQPYTFTSKNDDLLLDYIRKIPNDGATRIDQIAFPKSMDAILVFSDLNPTIGTSELTAAKIPMHVITSSAGADVNLAKYVAEQTGGKYLDLLSLSKSNAIEEMGSENMRLISVDVKSGKVSELTPAAPHAIGEQVQLSGKLVSAEARLTLNYGYGNRVVQSDEVLITTKKKGPVARIWADQQIDQLSRNYSKNKAEILALSQEFRVLARGTSFLVLDRVEDYVTYEIEPPAEMLEDYRRLMSLKPKEKIWSVEEINTTNKQQYYQPLAEWYDDPIVQYRGNKLSESAPMMELRSDEVELDLDVEITEETVIEEIVFSEAPQEELVDAVAYNMTNRQEVPDNGGGSKIKVLSWQPDAPYMEDYRNVPIDSLESTYLRLKQAEKNRPAFYLQTADFLFQKGNKSLASRVLSNILELDLENPELMKIAGRKFLDEGMTQLAILLFEEVKNLRPEEPQSYRDLALAYEAKGDYQRAFDLYVDLLNQKWERFEPIKAIVINEINRLISLHAAELDTKELDKSLVKEMPLDVRVVIDWSSNDNDIDLWVVDPNGEKCFYSNPKTSIGGKISQDFTRGYGPEEFSLKDAKRGIYTIYANYYSESRQRITGPVTIYAQLFTNYGTDKEEMKRLTIQLEDNKETHQIGLLEFED